MPPIRIGFVPIARPTFDVPLAEQMSQTAYQQLQTNGFEVVGTPALLMSLDAMTPVIENFQANMPDVLLLVQASFADSTMAVHLVQNINLPLVLWAIPEERVGGRLRLNSFCGINLAGHGLTRAGFTYEYVYAPPDDAAAIVKIRTVALAAQTKKLLEGTRIGRIGENPAGFDTCLVNDAGLKNQFGVDIVQVELNTVFEKARNADSAAVDAALENVKAQVAGIDSMDATATRGTLSAYVAMREMAQDEQLSGLAVRCWPEFFTETGCAACGAMSMLSNSKTPASCEADVNGTLTQLMLQHLSGEPAFGSDIVSFDMENDTTILWHCGLAPLSMADPDSVPEATIHSNRKLPLLMQFPLKPGRVTLARLSEATGQFRLVIGSGEMLKAPAAFTGTCGTLRFDSGAASVMDTMLREGLEHHLSLVYGDYVEALLVLARLFKLPVLRL
jgi:L-fucose isomerase-like protein